MKLEEAKDRMLNRNNNNTVWLELGTQQLLASVFIDSRTVVVLCLLFLFLRKIILFVNSKALIDNSVWLYIVAGGSIFFWWENTYYLRCDDQRHNVWQGKRSSTLYQVKILIYLYNSLIIFLQLLKLKLSDFFSPSLNFKVHAQGRGLGI